MITQPGNIVTTFRPRPSYGWLWLLFMAGIITALGIAPALAIGPSSASTLLTLLVCSTVALAFVVLAVWFPTMRYVLDREQLTLLYGPVLRYRIPLKEIHAIRRRDLSMTIWSTIRFPGIALFSVPYGDVGSVKMCATAALNRILLLETENGKYGLTPEDEEAFVTAVKRNMEA